MTTRGLRICLLTGGGYPYRRDALAGWCRTLVEGVPDVTFDVLAVTDREPAGAPGYPLPPNVASVRAVALHREERRWAGDGDLITPAAVLLCRGLLGEQDNAHEMFAEGLRRLTAPDGAPDPLAGVPLADLLMDAWLAGRTTAGTDRPLPRLAARDARTSAHLLRNAARALSVRSPAADLVHCVGGTAPLLAALAVHWRTDTPLLLTEARPAVPRMRLGEQKLSQPVRAVLRLFRRAVVRTGYAEARLIAPLSSYHHRWARRLGAGADRLVSVPAGVDPRDYAAAAEPAVAGPALVWAGGGGPNSGLDLLLDAFATVLSEVPGTVLHLVGVTAEDENHCAARIERSGLGRSIRLHPLRADRRDRYAPGHVVVYLPGPADPPYRLIEAMMSGRAVVALDVGPAAETLGRTGVLVPPGPPTTLAHACIDLLRSPRRRRALGEAARRRAMAHFTTGRMTRAYGALYADLAAPPPAPAFELALAVPAPRTDFATSPWRTP